MASKARQLASQSATDSPRGDVGEIDTRAPFESVKAAVSLFGEVAFSADRAAARKPKPSQGEASQNVLVKETELHLAQKELNKYKEQLNNAETTRMQALNELERAKKIVEELSSNLNAINKSKELAIKVTEAAKSQTKLLDGSSNGNISKDGSLKQELDSAREQYAAALADLDVAKHELRRVRKDFETSMEAKLSAIKREAEAKLSSEANTEKAARLCNEIAAAQESVSHVKLATEQAQQEEAKIHSEKDSVRKTWKQALEETEEKLAYRRREFDSGDYQGLKVRLDETNAEIAAVQKQMQDSRLSDLEFVANFSSELDEAKDILQKVAVEEGALMSLVESLKLEVEAVKKEHNELRVKDAETETILGDLHAKLEKCKAELEAAVAAELKAASASDDLVLALEQLSSESKTALEEAEVMKRNAEALRGESEAVRVGLAEAESKLQGALKEAEEAKAAEARALDQIKELSERANAARASSASEPGAAKITISKEEFDSLSRKVEESEKLSEMKVAAAIAQVEAVKASGNEANKRLDAARKELEDIEAETEAARKRAETAAAAKKAIEAELRRWREKEQTYRVLAETQGSSPMEAPTKPENRIVNPVNKSFGHQKTGKGGSKKYRLSNLSGIFYRKKSHADGGSPSYLPGEGSV